MTTQFANAVTWQELQPGGICRLSVDPRRQAEKERGHHEAGEADGVDHHDRPVTVPLDEDPAEAGAER